MEHSEFQVGKEFECVVGRRWMCTDKGARVIVAIPIIPEAEEDPSWLNGPPYALAEVVFDELDQEACKISTAP